MLGAGYTMRMNAKALMQLMDFWPARVLITAAELDLFAHLADWQSANSLSLELGADAPALERLLCALAGLEVLEQDGGRYRVPEHLRTALLPGPECITGLLEHRVQLWQNWSGLTDAVLLGQAAAGLPVARSQRGLRRFMSAMAVSGHASSAETAGLLPLAESGTALDVGGGPAVYAEAFCLAQPNLRAVELDLPAVCELARERLAASPVRQRISFIEGDALEVEPEAVLAASGGGFDLVFMSNLIHSLSPAEVRELFRRCCLWVRPGGALAVKDFFLDDTRTQPARNALFALNMLVGTVAGTSYTWNETEGWLREAAGARVSTLARHTLSDGASGIILVRLS
jgi:hypothetical protein